MATRIAASASGSLLHMSQGAIESVEHLINVVLRHRRTEPVMTGRAAVVVEVHAMFDGQLYEPEHRFTLVPNGVAVIADRFRDPEIDAEARAQALNPCLQAVAGEKR